MEAGWPVDLTRYSKATGMQLNWVEDYRLRVRVLGDAGVSNRAPVNPGEHNVVVHGDVSGLTGASQEAVNAAVANNPSARGCMVRFLSCFGATNGSGQALADSLGQDIWAATSRVGIPKEHLGPPYPVILEGGGEWIRMIAGDGR